MYEITVKWPGGRKFTSGDYTSPEVTAISAFLWASGADDVKAVCTCTTCETCTDYAAWNQS